MNIIYYAFMKKNNLNTNLNVYNLQKKKHARLVNYVTCIQCGSMVEWLTHQTGNLRIACHMSSNPVRGKSLFP